MRFINLWKYWQRKRGGFKDLTIIAIDIHDTIPNGGRIVIFNIGVAWSYKQKWG